MMNTIYEPILAKVDEWIADGKPCPNTVISLWNMLQLVLAKFNNEKTLREPGELNYLKTDIGRYLPEDRAEVQQLSELFRLGSTKVNEGFPEDLRLPESMRSPAAQVEHVQEVLKSAMRVLRWRRDELLRELMNYPMDMDTGLTELLQTRIADVSDLLSLDLSGMYVGYKSSNKKLWKDFAAEFYRVGKMERYETADWYHYDHEFEPIYLRITGVIIELVDVDGLSNGRTLRIPEGYIKDLHGGTLQEFFAEEGLTPIPLEIARNYGLQY